MKLNIKIASKLIFIFITLSIFFDFFYSIDFGSGGLSKDFFLTFQAVKDLSNYNLESFGNYTRHFPLHYFLLSLIYKVFSNEYGVRLIYLISSLVQPLILYKILKKTHIQFDKNILLIFSSFIFILPFSRSSIVWANAHSTGFIFFLFAVYFLITFLKKNNFFSMFLSIFFLSCSVYSVQYYAAFFIIFLVKVFYNFNLKVFFKYCLTCSFFSLPGFYFLFKIPSTADIPFSNNFINVFFISFSIIFFYSCFFLNNNSINILINSFLKKIKTKFFFLILIVISIYFLSFKFDYPYFVGGGFFYKFSLIFFQTKIIFFASSLAGLFLLFLIISNLYDEKKKNNENVILAFAILTTYLLISFSYMIFQKYYEPTFILCYLFFLKSRIYNSVIKSYRNLSISFLFCVSYLFSTFIYIKFFN